MLLSLMILRVGYGIGLFEFMSFSYISTLHVSHKGFSVVFSTSYTTLPHNLIKDKLVDLIESIFQRECSLYIVCTVFL